MASSGGGASSIVVLRFLALRSCRAAFSASRISRIRSSKSYAFCSDAAAVRSRSSAILARTWSSVDRSSLVVWPSLRRWFLPVRSVRVEGGPTRR